MQWLLLLTFEVVVYIASSGVTVEATSANVCISVRPEYCLSSVDENVVLGNVSSGYLYFVPETIPGAVSLQLVNSTLCLEENNNKAVLANCSTGPSWSALYYEPPETFLISSFLNNLSHNLVVVNGSVPFIVPADEIGNSSETHLTWILEGFILPTNAPTQIPTSPTTPFPKPPSIEPYRPFSTPFKIAYQTAFILLVVLIIFLLFWKFELLPSWCPRSPLYYYEGLVRDRSTSLTAI